MEFQIHVPKYDNEDDKTVKFESLGMIWIHTFTQNLFQNRAILLSPYKAEVVPIEASKNS